MSALRILRLRSADARFIRNALGVQLTDDTDWVMVAGWCGGELANHPIADTGEYETLLRLPSGETAGEDDWIVTTGPADSPGPIEFTVWDTDEFACLYRISEEQP